MKKSDNKSIVWQYIEDVWNNEDLLALEKMTHPEFKYSIGGQQPLNKDEMIKFINMVHAAFPDWSVKIINIVGEDDITAVRWEGEVTHKGTFYGIPPTKKKVKVSGMNFYQLKDGKIIREWEQMDTLGLLQQLGVIPPSK